MGALLSDTTFEAVVVLPSLQTLSWSTPHVHFRGLRLEKNGRSIELIKSEMITGSEIFMKPVVCFIALSFISTL